MRRVLAPTVLLLACCAAPSRQLKLYLNRRLAAQDHEGGMAAVDARSHGLRVRQQERGAVLAPALTVARARLLRGAALPGRGALGR